ncbi:GNAT family N-acetyltransferase [Cognatishimia sp. MH4019]|uniref:GNAT family N-acetyltransferase n=1 Tax=Cognatishimia sp. MH4019 TaxID=2854030 RepID=UPI001CD46E14|nr:GNAT family N-acetyltransferase [Cognatishimia sp. MH4019]
MIEKACIAPRIREGRAADAEACAGILNDWIDRTDWMPRLHGHRDVVRHYRDVVFATRKILVAGDKPEGFLALDEDAQMVTALYLANPGQGLGSALLDRAKEGRDRLSLWTFVANAPARRFYERTGFSEIRRTGGENEENLPDTLLQWVRV